MNSSYPVIQKHGIPFRAWLLIFFVAVALHLLLFFLFRPLRNDIAKSSRNDRYTVFLTEKDLRGRQSDPHGLRYWLHYMDPEQVLKSDPDSGFSMFCGKANVAVPDPAKFPHSLFRFSPEADFQLFPAASERVLSDFVTGADFPVMDPASLQKSQPETAVRYPVWTDESGTVFSGLFYPDRKSLRILEKQRSAKPTFLRLHVERDGIPYVKILRSCGNTQLDMLAVRQLKVRKENFDVRAGSQVKYFRVSWQSPARNDIIKEVQP